MHLHAIAVLRPLPAPRGHSRLATRALNAVLALALAATTAAVAPTTAAASAPAAPPPAAPPPAAPPPAVPAAGAATGGQAAEARVSEAANLAAAGKFKEAIAKLEALRREPACPPRAVALLGALYLKVNRPKEALAVLRPLAAPADAQPAVLYNAGLAALAVHDVPAADGYLVRAVRQQPGSPATRELGLLRAHQGRVVEAYSMLRPWSLRNPKDGEALLTAAAVALQLDRPEEAEQLIAGMPQDDPGIVLLRGKILVQKGDGKGAVALLTPLLAHHPQGMEPEVRRTLAEGYVAAGQPKPAVDLLKDRVAGHPAVALVLAVAQHKSGDVLGALVTLRPFADQLPADAKGLGDPRPATGIAIEYGRLLVDAGRSQEAVTVLEKATHILPQSLEAWQSLSQAYGAAGRRADSQAAAARAEALKKAALVPPAPQKPPPPGR
ncbi:MAG TPA: tetratricopeptide repeat protein [Thermoanaerobaculia bacterium]|jgi:predicted Zn-dependent protease|nr:tetratricopeptide repeat protein [Thermoanaerobaculia bacterium]